MPIARSASSSDDLTLAREISRRLVPSPVMAAAVAPRGASAGYVRFRADVALGAVAAPGAGGAGAAARGGDAVARGGDPAARGAMATSAAIATSPAAVPGLAAIKVPATVPPIGAGGAAPLPMPPAPVPELRLGADELAGAAGWVRILDWVRSTSHAEAAFLTDARGLVIAIRGDIADDDAQSIGARVVIAFAHADQMDVHSSRSLAIEFDDRWLTGLRIPFGDEELIVGLLAAAPMSAALRGAVIKAFEAKIQSM